MKKVLFSIFLFLSIFMIMGNVEAKERIEITNVSIIDKSDNISAKVHSFDNLTINTRESFYGVGEYVTYKINIKNITDDTLPIDKISDNLQNEFIETEYNYEKVDIESGKEYAFTVTVKYKNQIDSNTLNLNSPIEIIIDYANGEQTTLIANPKTKDNIIMYFIIFVITAISFIVFKKKRKYLVVILILVLVPSTIYALSDKISINMNNNIGLYKDELTVSTAKQGTEVNKIFKTLAGDVSDDINNYENTNIKHIVIADKLPENIELTDDNIISIEESKEPVYAWYSNETIYLYTKSDKIFLNENSLGLFVYLTALEDVDTSKFDTSRVKNMQSMFYGCRSLKTVDLSNFDTSNVTTLKMMFCKCSSLEEVDLSYFDTTNVTNLQSMFYNCLNLKKVNLSSFDTSNVTTMRTMFYECKNLEKLDLSHFNTSKVENMQSMFSYCNSLEELNIKNFDTSNVTTMQAMFYECSSLKELDVTSFDTSKVTTMRSMFYKCSNLSSLDVSSFNTSNVTTMAWMFGGVDSIGMKLERIDGLENFDTSNVTTMQSMFSGCYLMKEINVSNFNTSKVTSFAAMFHDCSGLEKLDVSGFDTSSAVEIDHMFNICNQDPSGVKYSKLKYLDLTNFDTTNVERMDYFLESLRYLNAEITIRTMKVDRTKLEDTFEGSFSDTARMGDSKVVINYTKDTEEFVDQLVNTRSPKTANIVKGRLVE